MDSQKATQFLFLIIYMAFLLFPGCSNTKSVERDMASKTIKQYLMQLHLLNDHLIPQRRITFEGLNYSRPVEEEFFNAVNGTYYIAKNTFDKYGVLEKRKLYIKEENHSLPPVYELAREEDLGSIVSYICRPLGPIEVQRFYKKEIITFKKDSLVSHSPNGLNLLPLTREYEGNGRHFRIRFEYDQAGHELQAIRYERLPDGKEVVVHETRTQSSDIVPYKGNEVLETTKTEKVWIRVKNTSKAFLFSTRFRNGLLVEISY